MRFQTPQFIEVEDKIFGPLTFKQFLYLAGGAGLGFIVYRLLPTLVAIMVIIPVLALALALAFYKINNKPFIYAVQAGIKYFLNQKLYVWKKPEPVFKKPADTDQSSNTTNYVPRLSASKLKDLAWSLDVNDNTNNNSNG